MLNPGLLALPEHRKVRPFAAEGKPYRALISFGAEDPLSLSIPTALALSSASDVRVEVLKGAAGKTELFDQNKERIMSAGINLKEFDPNVKEEFASYDLIVSHYGLTAFEALAAGSAVLLISPTAYHERLARAAGFVSAGRGKRGIRRLSACLKKKGSSAEALIRHLEKKSQNSAAAFGLDKRSGQNLAGLIGGVEIVSPRSCPACGASPAGMHPVIGRFSERSYRRCSRCGMIYMLRLKPPPIEYSRDYFFDDYKKQYGKTYLEDFLPLAAAGRKRAERIKELLRRNSAGNGAEQPRVLDIGCAYGPFLFAAREAGFDCTGIDPSADGVHYIVHELGIPAREAFFPDTEMPDILRSGYYDAVSLWYVAEHLRDLRKALDEIRRILKPGGVLAFSTPSCSGISGRKNLQTFLEQSPADHWTVWDPRHTGKMLELNGFRLEKTVITGHHPERFPFSAGLSPGKKAGRYGALHLASRFFGLGDTFEGYARKTD